MFLKVVIIVAGAGKNVQSGIKLCFLGFFNLYKLNNAHAPYSCFCPSSLNLPTEEFYPVQYVVGLVHNTVTNCSIQFTLCFF